MFRSFFATPDGTIHCTHSCGKFLPHATRAALSKSLHPALKTPGRCYAKLAARRSTFSTIIPEGMAGATPPDNNLAVPARALILLSATVSKDPSRQISRPLPPLRRFPLLSIGSTPKRRDLIKPPGFKSVNRRAALGNPGQTRPIPPHLSPARQSLKRSPRPTVAGRLHHGLRSAIMTYTSSRASLSVSADRQRPHSGFQRSTLRFWHEPHCPGQALRGR